jgi:transglutaminase-like putative cysteine protease
MRLDIRFVTKFSYEELVRESLNELRACPTSDERQQLISYRVTTSPSARILSTWDYWGTRVDAFGVRVPHLELEIVAEAVVDTGPVPVIETSPGMEALADPEFRDAHTEYLQRSPHASWGEGIVQAARRWSHAASDDVVDVVLALNAATAKAVSYAPGATYVGVDVEQVLRDGGGVCQDFAHLYVALCRSIGIPARYVSGYLFTSDDATGADATADVVSVQTHAWAEVAVPGAGWFPLDPTNHTELSDRHVKIGHGRDYDDVPPLRGVFSGPAEHDLDVHVEMRRMAAVQQQQQ